MSEQFELYFDANVKEADDIEIAEYNFSPTLLENGVIDYSGIQHDKIFLVNKKDILQFQYHQLLLHSHQNLIQTVHSF